MSINKEKRDLIITSSIVTIGTITTLLVYQDNLQELLMSFKIIGPSAKLSLMSLGL